MAPRKPASPAKPRRVTRARAADSEITTKIDELPKRKPTKQPAVPTTARAKEIEAKSKVTKKADLTASKTTRSGRTSNKTAKSTTVEEVGNDINDEEDPATLNLGPARSSRGSTRKTVNPPVTTATSGLAAAPRRRIRVTPLDSASQEAASSAKKEAQAEKKSAAKASSSRGKRDAGLAKVDNINDATMDTEMQEPESKKRGRTRTTKLEKEQPLEAQGKTSSTSAKTRGRSKKEGPPASQTCEPVSTRQTRSRAGSAASSVALEPPANLAKPPKKKVTFEALPDDDEDEDEKENKRPANMSKSKTTKPSSATTRGNDCATKGMRAKPLRRPVAARTTKSTRVASSKTRLRPVPEAEVEDTEKSLPRVLTPKKITQVAKAVSQESEDEDELAGPDTPVRDLSLSPKRNLNTSAPPQLSPAKKLDLTPALDPASSDKSDIVAVLGISSPPRRLPASPPKESFKDSPRRVPEGVNIFRAQVQDLSLGLSPAHKHSQLLQSPKRGLNDQLVFPPSAVKAQMSPAKTSLLSSPARRLFSPSKQKTPARVSPSPKKSVHDISSDCPMTSPGIVEVAVSSHFRSSVSPQRSARVYKMNDDELARENSGDLDFDESILNVRSPLKMSNAQPVAQIVAERMEEEELPVPGDDAEINDQDQEETVSKSYLTNTDNTATPIGDNDETIIDPDVEMEDDIDSDDGAEEEREEGEEAAGRPAVESSINKTRMYDSLFRQVRDSEDESDDEIAVEQTPDNRILKPYFRPSLSATNGRSRVSAGVAPASASRNIGFTPLVAQVQEWQAASLKKRSDAKQTGSQDVFSPVAQVHIAGSVEVNRHDTPVRETKKRKSLASRLSFAPSMASSPAGPNFFAEGMAAQDFADQNESRLDITQVGEEDLHDLIQQDTAATIAQDDEASDEADGVEGDSEEEPAGEAGELTTDLIKFTNASDTAMVDFKSLANEAENMAVEGEAPAVDDQEVDHNSSVPLPEANTEEESILTSSASYGDENAAPFEEEASHNHDELSSEHEGIPLQPTKDEEEEIHAPESTFRASINIDLHTSIEGMDFNVTPIRPDPTLPRYVHTVVSKVPLRPEGQIQPSSSPLKIQRKRPRSLSSSNTAGVKRRSLGLTSATAEKLFEPLATPRANAVSPQRRIRSAAPSPAGSLLTTPGQTSFNIDDFGDSTLDGIEIPDEELLSDDIEETEKTNMDDSVVTIGSALFKTPAPIARSTSRPKSGIEATPRYAMSTNSSRRRSNVTPAITPSRTPIYATRTPVSVSKAKTPNTSLKGKNTVKTPQTTRTPLKSVGEGILNGAIVHTDIHTSEGMDASAFYIDMLTSMGARVVKEWRWNPRASLTTGPEPDQLSDVPSAVVGITHVIYKDGGKRTLEKVRSAKGQVLCVGVGWVLDCMREGKWLEESAYEVDQSIMPRGGSRRRKSMEPRMLINANGSLSASRENRRSLSAEYLGVTDEMKMELINTPVRGNKMPETVQREVGDETEISSTYDSPTAATVGGGGDTADLGRLVTSYSAWEDSDIHDTTPGSVVVKKTPNPSATPQSMSLAVDYDPRTAATPLTPYLVAKGRDLVQMSAPPKQLNKGIFDRDDDEEGDEADKSKGNGRKFQVKMNGKAKGAGKNGFLDARRRTLAGVGMAFKPAVGSPLRKA